MYIYAYSTVPSLSPICNDTFKDPQAVTKPENVRWFILFPHAYNSSETLETYFHKTFKEATSGYKKTVLPLHSKTVFINEPDIASRFFQHALCMLMKL